MSTVLDDAENDLNADEGEEESPESASLIFSLGKRLLFPTLSLVFVLLYLGNTWGKISFRNLWYPYFIITCALVLLVSIYATEIFDMYRSRDEYSATIIEDVRTTFDEWRLSIWIVGIAVGYLYVVNYLGFFPSSAVMLAVMMKIGGVKKWSTIGLITAGTLVFVYVAFIMVLGVRPPSGPLEVF